MGDSPAGCRNLVYTDHSELPSRSSEEDETGVRTQVRCQRAGQTHRMMMSLCLPCRCRGCRDQCWCCQTGCTHSGHSEESLCIQRHNDHTGDLWTPPYMHTDLQTHLCTCTNVCKRTHKHTHTQFERKCYILHICVMAHARFVAQLSTTPKIITWMGVVSGADWRLRSSQITVTLNTWRFWIWRNLYMHTQTHTFKR